MKYLKKKLMTFKNDDMLNETIEQFSWSCCTPLNPDLEV